MGCTDTPGTFSFTLGNPRNIAQNNKEKKVDIGIVKVKTFDERIEKKRGIKGRSGMKNEKIL